MSTIRLFSRGRLPLVALIAVLLSGCTVQEQRLPELAGPSELGLGMSLTAAPEILPRDGSSMSTITARTFDSNGKPLSNQRLVLLADAGVLSAPEVVTNGNGIATFTYIAPGLNENVSVASIYAMPVQNTHYQNVNPRIVQIALVGPYVPDESFTFSPDEDIVPLQAVNFDALTPEEGKVRCGAPCDYHWDFGDNTTGQPNSGQGVQHRFPVPGVFTVTLTVTSPSGTFGRSSKLVTVGLPEPPVALWDVTPTSPLVNTDAAYESKSTVGDGATIVEYLWEFSDGAIGVTPVVAKRFTTIGVKTVKLTVKDNLGRVASLTKFVTVVP